MGTTGAVGSLVTFMVAIVTSLYVARWLWRQGDRKSGIEGKEEQEDE